MFELLTAVLLFSQAFEVAPQATPAPTPVQSTPSPTPPPQSGFYELGNFTAYSCNGFENEAQRRMNCPNGVTAMGNVPKAGVTVACSKKMFGKTIEIEGFGTRTCQDRGGAIVGNKIDLYVSSIAEAKRFGRRKLRYRVIHK